MIILDVKYKCDEFNEISYIFLNKTIRETKIKFLKRNKIILKDRNSFKPNNNCRGNWGYLNNQAN